MAWQPTKNCTPEMAFHVPARHAKPIAGPFPFNGLADAFTGRAHVRRRLIDRPLSLFFFTTEAPMQLQKSEHPRAKLRRIAKRPIEIAIDTEYEDVQTLTVQAATRIDETIVVQVWRSPGIPHLPSDVNSQTLQASLHAANAHNFYCKNLIVRRSQKLTEKLSPTGLVQMLYGLRSLHSVPRWQGEQLITDDRRHYVDAEWDRELKRWRLPQISIVLVGHFLAADLGRIFGRSFFETLFWEDGLKCPPVGLADGRRMAFLDRHNSFRALAPVLEYAALDEHCLYEVRVETRDTCLPYGSASLDRLSQVFLGRGKSDGLTPDEKQKMKSAFTAKPSIAYRYALTDAFNTLLVFEQMEHHDREIYRAFDVPEEAIPPMAATVGGRLRDFLVTMTRRFAHESTHISTLREVKELMQRAGIAQFHGPHANSRFGPQTGAVHGGLSYSRTPTQFWHKAPRMIRDVDLASCYNSILSTMNVYWGRPVVLEPGKQVMTLADAVAFVRARSPDDAWYIRCTGNLTTAPNTLIPSTINAITSDNYRTRRQKARLAAFRTQLENSPYEHEGAKLFSHRIESGIVTHATWSMIQSLPQSVRDEYGKLRVDAIVFYDRRFIATDGPDYDAKIEAYRSHELPWQSTLCDETLQLIHREDLDHEFVALRFPISVYARQISLKRAAAKQQYGKGSGQDFAWKMQGNTMFGVLVCRHYPTNNVVAGNYITAQARALAFAMMQSLNGLQVITDGCSYRRDRIPACTYAECLAAKPDYPLRHVDESAGIPFHKPEDIPVDDQEFTMWYREHVKSFFEVDGKEYDSLFSTHKMEHKHTGATDRTDFDAMACDGNGNYLKILLDSGHPIGHEAKMRGYGRESKAELENWIVETYSQDDVKSLAPITSDTVILKLAPAKQAAKRALTIRGVPEVYLPISLEMQSVRCFKAIKPSAFVFQTPDQWKVISRQIEKFQQATGCGLELIALRRDKGKSRRHSLQYTAETLYDYIRAGGRDLTKQFNLRAKRLSKAQRTFVKQRAERLRYLKRTADQDLFRRIDVRNPSEQELLTGIVINGDNLHLLEK
jgi:hypothetical protein